MVLRSIPTEISDEEISKDLEEQGFKPDLVRRMRKTRDRQPMPPVLVKVSREQKNIYHLTEVLGLQVSVETLRARPEIGQCFNCQKFGHAQSRCTAIPKCVKCGGEHRAYQCQLPREEPPSCANCGEAHPASYRGCTKFPKLKTPTARSTEFRSYAGQVKQSSTIVPARNTPLTPRAWPALPRQNRTPRSSRKNTQHRADNPNFTGNAGGDLVATLGSLQQVFGQFINAVEQLRVILPANNSR